MFFLLFLVITLAFLLSFFVTPLVIKIFRSHNWVENPLEKQKKTGNATATSIIPRGGGLPIFISLLVTSLVFLPPDKHLIGILMASFFTLIIGLIDDIKDISPVFRLSTNFLTALIVVAAGIGIAYLSNPLGGIINLTEPQILINFLGTHSIWIFADLLAVFWIVWCMNFVGWSSGVEGQLPGFVSISAIFIGLLGLRYSTDTTQWPVIILAFTVAGAYLGFLPYNFYPQKIMPGYSGKSLAGLLLAVLSILSGAKLATLIFLLGIPMLDAFFVLFYRLIHHKSPFKSDNNHLHHQLLKLGWGRRRIAVFYWSLTLLFGLLSLFLNSQQKFYTFIGIAIIFFAFTLKFFRRI
ncbi:MAG: MraY family glycosyltransferase [Candidatus Shapirobacteria bacterium]|jgi:UDP-GlcNAc:undecaprenyl-phosphate GlcNAc-1-phosphate transferase